MLAVNPYCPQTPGYPTNLNKIVAQLAGAAAISFRRDVRIDSTGEVGFNNSSATTSRAKDNYKRKRGDGVLKK
jgi:hypothetical protein